MKSLPDLVIDTNERGPLCDAIERGADRNGISVARHNLPVGDYLLGDKACVEAKRQRSLSSNSILNPTKAPADMAPTLSKEYPQMM